MRLLRRRVFICRCWGNPPRLKTQGVCCAKSCSGWTKGRVDRRDDKGEISSTRPGDLWVTDLAQRSFSVASQAEAINLITLRRLLSPLLGTPDIHSMGKLSYLLAPLGDFVSWVRKRRLVPVRSALTDPEQMHRTIEEIAEARGFSHRANLGRAFREFHGLTPGQVRALVKERLPRQGFGG